MSKLFNKNIVYKSEQLLSFYKNNRKSWGDFYPSEKWVFQKIAKQNKGFGDVLDVGCGCGGLALALGKQFTINSYTGIDINRQMIEWAKIKLLLPMPSKFVLGDIIHKRFNKRYDSVISLSCVDWNILTIKMINACWQKVKPGGYFIISLRLTAGKTINNIKESYQFINFNKSKEKPEIANYVVFNFNDAIILLSSLLPSPGLLGAYGYWGKPSSTAVTPFSRIFFTVFYLKKKMTSRSTSLKYELNFPINGNPDEKR